VVQLVDRRVGLLFAAFLVLLAFAAARAAWFGAVRAPVLQKAAATQQTVHLPVPAPRGTITDRHGVLLATSESAADVSATPYLVKHPDTAARRLAPLLGRPEDEILRKLVRRDTGFVYLGREVPGDRAEAIRKLDLVGIQLTPRTVRTYPRSFLASQVLGTVGTDGKGLSGLEYGLERFLSGRNGERTIVNDALGQPISMRDSVTARPGAPVQLTLDAALQAQVEQSLEAVGRDFQPKGATAIVMDPKTSDVLALANWPRIDANHPGAAPEGVLTRAQLNRAVGYTYEPGSTFKAITVAAALQDKLVTPSTEFDLPVEIQIADRRIHDAEERGPERRTVAQILAQSSNVGGIEIGQRLGGRRFDRWVRRFGFGKPTGVGLPGEEGGIILPYERYSGSSMGNLPIGQGESVTPMQMVSAYAAIANGGILRRPRLLRSVAGRRVPLAPGRRVISPGVAGSLRTMLEGVLAPGGTASEAAIPGYALAGKTGTANKADAKGGYSTSAFVGSFMGFAPARDPRLLVAVVVDEPKRAIAGAVVAAPTFTKIMSFALPYLGIPTH
jgi:cell division protein FtsI (penicillin-binding protein 3)